MTTTGDELLAEVIAGTAPVAVLADWLLEKTTESNYATVEFSDHAVAVVSIRMFISYVNFEAHRTFGFRLRYLDRCGSECRREWVVREDLLAVSVVDQLTRSLPEMVWNRSWDYH